MVIQWLLNVCSGFSDWLTGLFPDWDVPDVVTGFPGTINAIVAGLSGVGAWVDWSTVMVCVTLAVGTWVVTSAIKLSRAIVSYLPFFGGSG